MKKKIWILFVICIYLIGCEAKDHSQQNCVKNDEYRKIFYSLVSSAENSSLDYNKQYAYIEDIGDGRGYTAGVIGFTSRTGDLLEVINQYIVLKPENNELEKYVSALEAVYGTDSHENLGDAFVADWISASHDPEMIAAQDFVVDEMYLNPALEFAEEDGLCMLGAFIYYDAMVVHGPGEDSDSFGGIRKAAQKNAITPAKGGDEAEYLLSFLDARSLVMQKEKAHSDLSRIIAQRKFISEGNFTLSLPLSWTMYGDDFELE
ncbi:MAG: chitosanase [Lachnospiraceae bacterium]|nr:chitosanase [Lachnospiraceae bacterium]